MEIISFTINLEHIGDIIDQNLSELAVKKIKRNVQFSEEGAAEIAAFHKRVLESLRIAFGIVMSGDADEARRLLAEKTNCSLQYCPHAFAGFRQHGECWQPRPSPHESSPPSHSECV
jgi:Na+/phosphate symporter